MPEVLRPDGAALYYETAGAGTPLLALAPGGVSSGIERWASSSLGSLTPLHSHSRVITMDQRHAGRSRATLVPFSYEAAMGDQLAVLSDAGVSRAKVLGVGIGAAYALRLAYDAPAKVNAMVLIEPMGVAGDAGIGDYYNIFNDTIRMARAEGLAGVVEAALANPSFVDNPAAGPWARRLHDEAAFREMLLGLSREMYIALVVDFRDGMFPWGVPHFSVNNVALERMRVPALVIAGDDVLHSQAAADALCANLGTAQQLTSAHNVDLKQGIGDFLADHPMPV